MLGSGFREPLSHCRERDARDPAGRWPACGPGAQALRAAFSSGESYFLQLLGRSCVLLEIAGALVQSSKHNRVRPAASASTSCCLKGSSGSCKVRRRFGAFLQRLWPGRQVLLDCGVAVAVPAAQRCKLRCQQDVGFGPDAPCSMGQVA